MNDLSRPQLRLIIFYEWSCGTPAAETVTKIGKVFGETTVTDRTVRNWFARFQSGEKCFEDNDRCGRPTALNNDLLRDAVKERPDVNMRELETLLGCSHQTISNHLHDLGYRRVLARWVPHALFRYQMQARGMRAGYSTITTPTALSGFLVGKSRQCSQRPISMRRNVCFPSSGNAKSMLYYELLPQRRTVNATTYSNEFAFLALALREKRQRRSAVNLLHDNARPHVAKATLFRPLKLFLKEKRFAEYENLKNGSVRLLRLAVRRVLEEGHRRPPRAMAYDSD
uniref:HTH_48 domain-containing protein n=1 Tax=Caenorhabditis japonica TaxID=281687 RepID=A0A8R1DM43_CAEJA